MAFAVFGPGSLYITRTDIANQTPVNIGYAQSFSLDEAGDTKQLFGQNQYALVAARGTIKTTGKVVAAEVSGIALNAAFHGSTLNAGQLLMVQGEAHSVPATTPFTFVITPPGSGVFDTDLGVVYAATGLPLQKVTALTAIGQYTQAGANYGFFSGEASAALLITYAYTATGSGQTTTITNQLIGTAPYFQIDYSTSLEGRAYYIRIFRAISSKLSQSFKLTDFMMPEIDFDIFANDAGQVYEVSYPNVG